MAEKLVVVGNVTNIILKTLFVKLQEVVSWESSYQHFAGVYIFQTWL